ncbi:MAG: transpeptidase family protein [Deltaproteobacteria bacterium]|nr:transpeptidase family protein [Deltaproteobacteria bacterium]
MNPRAFHARCLLVTAALCGPLLAVLVRAAWLQLGHGEQMRDLAEDQYLQEMTLSAPRGNITDRAGRPLAVSVKVPSIFAEPRHLADTPRAVARALAPVLKIPAAVLEKKMSGGRAFAWLARRVTPEMAAAVKRLKLDGIGITEESRRFYPNRELAAHVLGYTGVDGDGLDGVEKAFDDRLRGRKLQVDGFRDARGGRLLLGDFQPTENLQGDELVLTLDAQIQNITEQALARAVTEHQARSGFAIVLDPDTGAVLALANHPTFNPNDFQAATDEVRRNRAVADAFEPGSTMKVMLLASALDAGTVKLTDLINCENGVFQVGKHRIRDTHKAEILTVEDVLAHSSNIGALKIGTRMGRAKWGESLKAFGFGKRTGLGLSGETPGLMNPYEKWSDAALATVSFGQGISVSGIQLVTAVAAVAHGGVLMQPRLVERVRAADGRADELMGAHVVGRVVGPKAAALTLKAMQKVPSKDGTAPLAAVPGVITAGKTGTAQKVDPGTRSYGDGRIASFVGVAPAKEPKLVIFVMIDEPKDSPYGGIVAAPAFREIALQALPLLGVGVEAPAVEKEPVAQAVDPLAGARALAQKLAEDDPVDGIDEGVVADEVASVPNFVGMGARAAVREALKAGLDPALDGNGTVVAQRPAAGKALQGERTVRLTLKPGRGNG